MELQVKELWEHQPKNHMEHQVKELWEPQLKNHMEHLLKNHMEPQVKVIWEHQVKKLMEEEEEDICVEDLLLIHVEVTWLITPLLFMVSKMLNLIIG
jgi:hypothetical protein